MGGIRRGRSAGHADLRRNGQNYAPGSSTEITAEQLRETADWQQVDIRSGDILCVRMGWPGHYLSMPLVDRRVLAESGSPEMAGLAGSEDVARTLWDWGISAIVAANTSIQAMPIRGSSLHDRLPNLGFAMGELFVLDSLAEACRAECRWSFLFAGIPLKIPGRFGSTGNSVAIR